MCKRRRDSVSRGISSSVSAANKRFLLSISKTEKRVLENNSTVFLKSDFKDIKAGTLLFYGGDQTGEIITLDSIVKCLDTKTFKTCWVPYGYLMRTMYILNPEHKDERNMVLINKDLFSKGEKGFLDVCPLGLPIFNYTTFLRFTCKGEIEIYKRICLKDKIFKACVAINIHNN